MGFVEELQISGTWSQERGAFHVCLWQPAATLCLHSTPFSALWRMEEILKAFALANLGTGNFLLGFIPIARKKLHVPATARGACPSPVLHVGHDSLIHTDEGMHLSRQKRSFYYLNDTFEGMLVPAGALKDWSLLRGHHQVVGRIPVAPKLLESCLFCAVGLYALKLLHVAVTEKKANLHFA